MAIINLFKYNSTTPKTIKFAVSAHGVNLVTFLVGYHTMQPRTRDELGGANRAVAGVLGAALGQIYHIMLAKGVAKLKTSPS